MEETPLHCAVSIGSLPIIKYLVNNGADYNLVDEILTKKVLKKSLKNSKIIVEVFFKVKEDITSFKDIVIDEAKREGD